MNIKILILNIHMGNYKDNSEKDPRSPRCGKDPHLS